MSVSRCMSESRGLYGRGGSDSLDPAESPKQPRLPGPAIRNRTAQRRKGNGNAIGFRGPVFPSPSGREGNANETRKTGRETVLSSRVSVAFRLRLSKARRASSAVGPIPPRSRGGNANGNCLVLLHGNLTPTPRNSWVRVNCRPDGARGHTLDARGIRCRLERLLPVGYAGAAITLLPMAHLAWQVA